MKKGILFLLVFLVTTKGFTQNLTVSNLTCEYKINPLGIDKLAPKLAWQLQSTQQHILQTAYRILVSDDSASLEQNIGNTWDSKKQKSSESIQITYQGKLLE